MPEQTAKYWEEKAARAIEAAGKATTTEMGWAFLEIAQNMTSGLTRAQGKVIEKSAKQDTP